MILDCPESTEELEDMGKIILFLFVPFWELPYPLPVRTSYMEAPRPPRVARPVRATSETPKERQYVKGIVVAAVQRWRLNSTRVIC